MNNPDCLFCGYPRRGDGEPCSHCSGTFPCCKPSAEKLEFWINQTKILEDKLRDLQIRYRLREIRDGAGFREDAWIWLGDGSDDLNSMSKDMLIEIRAADLQELISKNKEE